MPGPGVGNDLLQPPGGLPAQDFRRPLVGGDEHRRIPRPAGLQLGGDLPAGDFPGGVDDLFHGVTVAAAQIEHAAFAALVQMFQGQQMGFRQIPDVDIVPDAGAVGGGIVVAVDADVDRKSVV